MDIRSLLDEMMTIANELNSQFPLDDNQVQEQLMCIDIIKTNIDFLQKLYPSLLELLQHRSLYEAVRQMSTEWRTPFVPIIGYSQLIQEGMCGEFTDQQLSLIKHLASIAKQIRQWSDSPEQSN